MAEVAQLLSMGFSADAVQTALSMNNNKFDDALSMLAHLKRLLIRFCTALSHT